MRLRVQKMSSRLAVVFGVMTVAFLGALELAAAGITRIAALAGQADLTPALQAQITAVADSARLSSFGVGMAAVLAGGAVLALMLRPVCRSVSQLSAALRGAGEGRVRPQDLPSLAGAELGDLRAAIQACLEGMDGRLLQARETGSQAAAAASELSSDAADLNDEVARQHSEIDQVAAAINQMAATVQEVARNTAEASEAAVAAKAEAENGALQATNAISSIERLEREIANSTDVIHRVKEESNNIGTVLDVIRGISEQTNLLALNAAIEAARAGEQGRGFAVVADEVRTLATRTGSSIHDVESMIESLDRQATAAVDAMETASVQARKSVDSVEQAAMSLGEIAGAVKSISDMNLQVASATEEQSAVAEDVNRNIVSIAAITESAAANSRQMAETSDRLLREVSGLNRLLG